MRRLLVLVVLSSGCSSAHILDAGPDSGPLADAGPPDDAGPPGDAALSAPIAMAPTAPGDPLDEPALAWLDGETTTELAVANPVNAAPTAPNFGDCGVWEGGNEDPCEPFPSGHVSCSGGTEQFPGDTACTTVGLCPTSGPWADGITGAQILYVQSGAPAGGNGSSAMPFRTLQEGLTQAATRTAPVVVALSAGTYAGSFDVPAGTTVWGACPAQTILAASPGATVIALHDESALRNLRVQNGAIGVDVEAATNARLDAVIVEASSMLALSIGAGAIVVSNDLVLRDGAATAANVGAGGLLDVTHGVVRDFEIGIAATGARVVFNEVAVLDLRAVEWAIRAVGGGSFSGTGFVAENVHSAINVEIGGAVVLDRVVLRDLRGWALQTLDVSITIRRTHLDGSNGAGLGVHARGPAVVHDVIVEDVTGGSAGGIQTWGSTVDFQRVRIERVGGPGLAIWEGGIVTATSIDIRDTGLEPVETFRSVGITVTDGADLTLRASRITNATAVGILVGGGVLGSMAPPERAGIGTDAIIEDVEVQSTGPSNDGLADGHGLIVSGGAVATLTRVSLIDHPGIALGAGHASVDMPSFIINPGTIHASDVRIRGGGEGIVAGDGSTFTGDRIVLAGASSGVRSLDSSVTMGDLVIGDVLGDAIVATDASTIVLTAASIQRNLGLFARADAASTISITDATIGASGGARVDAGSLSLERVVASRMNGTGFDLRGAGTSLRLTDFAFFGDGSDASFGLVARVGPSVTATRASLEYGGAGVVALTGEDTSFTGTSIALACTTAPQPCAGLTALAGATAELTRALIEDGRGLGVVASGAGTRLELSDVRVRRTALLACGATTCAAALAVYGGASLLAEDLSIDESADRGVQLADDRSTATIVTSEVRRAPICVEEGGGTTLNIPDIALEGCGIERSSELGPRPALPAI